MKTEKPAWLKLKELHDAEIIKVGGNGRDTIERPRSRGVMYGPSESLVDQVGDGLIDVNHIMARFERMPTAEELAAAGLTSAGFYGDFIDAPAFEDALNISNAAKAQFALLPAHVRGRFENDPGRFLEFVGDPANADELVTMGLRKKPEAPKEPDVTLKDVRDAIQASQKPPKKASKGGGDGED